MGSMSKKVVPIIEGGPVLPSIVVRTKTLAKPVGSGKGKDISSILEKIPTKSFFEIVGEMYALPEQTESIIIRNGKAGLAQDAERIRSYFRAAERKIGA